MVRFRKPLGTLALFSFIALIAACGGDTTSADTDSIDTTSADAASADATAGIRVISADDAFELASAGQPDGLIVLDVRTPEEFDDQRLANATLIDFYEPDFAERIADLDRDAPYLLYCRSGNRSGQTRALMQDLGFTDVRDVDGGIVSWLDNGHPVTSTDG